MTVEPTAESVLSKAVRWEKMLSLLAERRRLSVAETAAELRISESTVRRDFDTLADRQLATRTHGGVVATSVAYDLPKRYRESAEARLRIAERAAQMVRAGETVGFNGGTTTTACAKALASRGDLHSEGSDPTLTVVTSALNIAVELVLRTHIRTICLGGVARAESYELAGAMTLDMIQSIWLDVLFVGVNGFDAIAGGTAREPNEARVTSALADHSERVVVLATAEKIGERAVAQICSIERVSALVTDRSADADTLETIRRVGVDVIVA